MSLTKNHFVFILLFCGILFIGKTCAANEDSLTSILEDVNAHDTSRASAYLELSEILFVSNFDTLIPLCEKSKAICERGLKVSNNAVERQSYLKTLSGAVNNIGYAHSAVGENEKALENYFIALKIQQDISDYSGLAISLNNIGFVYENQGLVLEALKFYNESAKISEAIGDNVSLAISLNNLGLIYKRQGDFEKSIEFYEESLGLRKQEKNQRGIAISYNNIGSVYYEMGETEIALMYYRKSLSIRESISDTRGIANARANIAKVNFELGDLEQAEKYIRNAIELSASMNDLPKLSENHILLSRILAARGDRLGAKNAAQKGYDIALEIGFPSNISIAAELLSEYEAQDGNGLKALELYQEHILMRDSTVNSETKNAFARDKAHYEYEKRKALDDAEYANHILLEQEKNQRQRLIIYVIIIGLVILIGFLFFISSRLRITRKQKEQISDQKQEIELKRKEILDSIIYAKRIQSAILPRPEIIREHLNDSFVFYRPKDIIAGDFYWLQKAGNSTLFAAADCTGHGVPGAMVSVVCNNGLNRAVREYGFDRPAQILNQTRDLVIDEFKMSNERVLDGMDIALCCFDFDQMKLYFSGANNPVYIIRDSELIEIKGDKQPVGLYDAKKPFTEHEFDLVKGDVVYTFTDGFADQFGGPKGKKFMYKRFKKLLISIHKEEMNKQRVILAETFLEWLGNQEQVDDVCVLGVRV